MYVVRCLVCVVCWLLSVVCCVSLSVVLLYVGGCCALFVVDVCVDVFPLLCVSCCLLLVGVVHCCGCSIIIACCLYVCCRAVLLV